jgi:cytochrome c556
MKRQRTALVALGLAAAFAGIAVAANTSVPSAPTSGPGWTGLTKPLEVIHARQQLMEHMEILMQPIDTITLPSQPLGNVEQLHANAKVVGAALLAVPHLFPPTTNLYDPKAGQPRTIALPEIWKSFDSFYSLAQAASHLADDVANAKGDKALRAASLKLRSGCDACHALYLRKYEPPKAEASDQQFDFDSALGQKKK